MYISLLQPIPQPFKKNYKWSRLPPKVEITDLYGNFFYKLEMSSSVMVALTAPGSPTSQPGPSHPGGIPLPVLRWPHFCPHPRPSGLLDYRFRIEVILLKIVFFWLYFSWVYSLKLPEFHLPQDLISSLLAKSELFAIAEGMAALKLWPWIFLDWALRWGLRRSSGVLLSFPEVRSFPVSNLKTGTPSRSTLVDFSLFLHILCSLARQQLWVVIGNKSMYSQHSVLFLLILMCINTELLLMLTSDHSSVSCWLNVHSVGASISLKQKEPKKAVMQAVQKTCFLKELHAHFVISWPNNFSKGRVITFLEFFAKFP